MTQPPKDVELYLHKALPTGDSITTGPLRAVMTAEPDGTFGLAVAAATNGEQVEAMAGMLSSLLEAMAERLDRAVGDVAVMAAVEVLAGHSSRGGDNE